MDERLDRRRISAHVSPMVGSCCAEWYPFFPPSDRWESCRQDCFPTITRFTVWQERLSPWGYTRGVDGCWQHWANGNHAAQTVHRACNPDVQNATFRSQKRHRRRATRLQPHMKTGLICQKWAGIMTTFSPVLSSSGQIFPLRNVEIRPDLPWGLRIVENSWKCCAEWCFCSFLRIIPSYIGIMWGLSSGISQVYQELTEINDRKRPSLRL